MDSDSSAGQRIHQNVVVLRHGDRIDHFDPLWTKTASRPWDPPLILDGKVRAFSTGKKLNNNLGFPIHRVFVSPFLRCLQTASEVVHAICAVGDDSDTHMSSADGVVIDPSKLKVSVEYGLCEALHTAAIQPESAPKDGDFGFNISECEKLLPKGTVDSSVERVYKELPKWEESPEGARDRYKNTIKLLADKYPTENLLLVTHAEGIWVAATAFTPERVTVDAIDYCAYLVLQRTIVSTESEPITPGEFNLCTNQGHTGVSTRPGAQEADAMCKVK
ncbi:Histidine phosphatase superfamily, clade-1 [Artemisia annua]|uniref:Histidine phosphatase superfamily, clade-1 n=1 Tax=Artemisia annua TaxID=35608 RepID=A0A2U1NK13_ARTAN|nr:Histidine phosphatase superfamily, clade-1 [Artemisia annua]